MRYKVVFTGKIAEGYILEKVKKNISEYFKLDYAEVENLFSGKPRSLQNKPKPEKIQAPKSESSIGESGNKTGTPVPQKSRVLTPAEKNKFQQARDLIAFYPFNGNANDESGNGNHGTVYGASLVKDRFGNADSAYSFDGVNDYIDIGRPLVSGGLYNQLLVEIKWPTKPVCRSDFTGQYVL